MSDRKRLQRAGQNRERAEDEIIRAAPMMDTADRPLVQGAQTNPTSLTARQVLQLQRTIGNHAVNNLLATNRQTDPTNNQ